MKINHIIYILILLFFVPFRLIAGNEVVELILPYEIKDIDISEEIPTKYINFPENHSITLFKEKNGFQSVQNSGFTPSSKAGAAFISIFSDKAHIGYIAKAFREERFEDAYEYYKNNYYSIEEGREEAEMIYALSALKIHKSFEGSNALRTLCINGTEYGNTACDYYSVFMYERDIFQEIVETLNLAGRQIPPASFSAYILSCFNLNDYEQASDYIDNNMRHIFFYPDFHDLYAVKEYYKGNYAEVEKISAYTSAAVAFIRADSYINMSKYSKAMAEIKKIPQSDTHNYLKAKYYISKKLYNDAFAYADKINNSKYVFALLNFYVMKEFPNIQNKYLYKFKIKDTDKKDYQVYFEALQNYYNKDYKKATSLFEKVRTAELKDKADFYKSMALIQIDPKAAEMHVAYVINSADAKRAEKARYMLAQGYYAKGFKGEALQLIDECSSSKCKVLAGEILLSSGNYEEALKSVEDDDSKSARLVKVAVYFARNDLEKAGEALSDTEQNDKRAKYLEMKIAFANDDVNKAKEIIHSEKLYKTLIYDGAYALAELGEGKEALEILINEKDLPSNTLALKASLLSSYGSKKEAEKIYKELILRKENLYDAFHGLLTLYEDKVKQREYGEYVLKNLNIPPSFEYKDRLLDELAEIFIRYGDNVSLLKVVNNFFPEYENSEYAGSMYTARAKLFSATGRSSECISDVKRAAAADEKFLVKTEFMEIECIEKQNIAEAVKKYAAIADTDNPVKLEAIKKVIDNASDPNDILGNARKAMKQDPDLYIYGVRKYIETIKASDLSKNTRFIKRLMEDSDKDLRCAGFYANGKVLQHQGKNKEAAESYHKVYVASPADYFTPFALDNAASLYTKLEMKKEAKNMKELKKKIK